MASDEPEIGHGAAAASDGDASWIERLLQVHFAYASRRAALFAAPLRGLDRVRAFTGAFDLIDQERAALKESRQALSLQGLDTDSAALETLATFERKLDAEQVQLNQLFSISRKPFDAFASPMQGEVPPGSAQTRDGRDAAGAGGAPCPADPIAGGPVAVLLKNNIASLDQKLQSQANLMYLGINNAFRAGGSAAARREKDIVLYHIDGWNNEIIRLRFEITSLNAAASTVEELIEQLDAVEKRWNEKAKSVQQLSYADPPAGFDPRQQLQDLRTRDFEDQRQHAIDIQSMIEDHNKRMSELTLRHAEELRRSRGRGS